MKNNKIGKVLVVFIIAMLGFLGYLIYSKLDLSSGKYLSESEFQTIDLDDGMVVRAINTLSFPYGHKQTDLENRLFNDSLFYYTSSPLYYCESFSFLFF